MRLPEVKIKEAILHPEKLVRQEAVGYFSNCFSQDPDVLPLAIQAIQKYGRRHAFSHVHTLENLAQTEATVDWAIGELKREEDEFEDNDVYFPALSRLLCRADPQVVAHRAKEITEASGFSQDLGADFHERLDLLTWDADRCWNELNVLCEQASTHEDVDVDFGRGSRVVEALARQGEKYTARILELLNQKVDHEDDTKSWLEIFLVMLAGNMRLHQAIPPIVQKLHEEGDFLLEECVNALGKIGSDGAVEAITEGWLADSWDYRLYATSALETIHTDATVRKCLELLPQDKDRDIRTKLADALLAQFEPEGIEPVRQMVQQRAYDGSVLDLQRRLVAVGMLLGVEFPELAVWKREAEEEDARVERRIKEMSQLTRLPAATSPQPRDESPGGKLVPFLREEKKVGRNDPCPCGSGKKVKKCCMSKK